MERLDNVLVRNILEHALDYPWRYQDVGLLSLRLDDHREYGLHVWDPDRCIGTPPIHDHPFDFVSRIIVGELTNTRYVEDPAGAKYLRERYTPGNEESRVADYVQLSSEVATLGEGDEYAQRAEELHDSHQLPGTVTVIRRSAFGEVGELTVCRLDERAAWVSGAARCAHVGRDQGHDDAGVDLVLGHPSPTPSMSATGSMSGRILNALASPAPSLFDEISPARNRAHVNEWDQTSVAAAIPGPSMRPRWTSFHLNGQGGRSSRAHAGRG